MNHPRHALHWGLLPAGLAAAVAMWVVWFIVHHPAVGLAPSASGPILLAVQGLSLSIAAWLWIAPGRRAPSILLGSAVAGLLSGTINLASMGSMLVPQADPAEGMSAGAVDRPALAVMIVGYLGLSVCAGILAGVVATLLPRRAVEASPQVNVHRVAVLALAATLPLLLLGGLVTSSRAGLAVPDWPGTNGGNMFLYPISLMASEKHVYLEHSHRLFGTLVGMTSILLLATTLRLERRGWMKAWAGGILALVCVQGLLGGFRVTESSTGLAMAHGVLGQIVFLMMAMFTAYAGDAYQTGPAEAHAADRRRRAMGTALTHSLILQLVLGAAYRHTGSAHVLYTHIAFAFLIVLIGMVAGMAASSRPGTDAFSGALRRTGMTVVAVVAIQFILGWGAWAANPPGAFTPVPKHTDLPTTTPVPAWKVAIRTAHQANGALLLAAAGVLFVLVRRIPRNASGTAAAPPVRPSPEPLSAAASAT